MKKLSNEVKVGITAVITILLFVWMFSFLKGKDFLKSNTVYYSVYNQVNGLAESSPVEVNGYKIGIVRSIEFMDAVSGKLLVTFTVNKHFRLPKNTVAEIVPVSVLGGMKVKFNFGKGPGMYAEGDTIPGMCSEPLTDKIDKEILPLKDKITNLVVVLDSVISSIDNIMDPEFRNNVRSTVAHLNHTSASLDKAIGSNEKELQATIVNIKNFTQMLSDNSGNVNKTLTNLGKISDSLASADIYGTVKNLKTSLEKTSSLIDNLNKGKGSAGQMLTNDSLYTNLSNSLSSLNLLLQDMKANPKKYVHFSVFGKK